MNIVPVKLFFQAQNAYRTFKKTTPVSFVNNYSDNKLLQKISPLSCKKKKITLKSRMVTNIPPNLNHPQNNLMDCINFCQLSRTISKSKIPSNK